MPLVTSKALLQQARRDGYAVGAFNINNLEMVQAVIEAAEAEDAPVIVQVSEGAIRYGGLHYLAAIVRAGAEHSRVPVVLHLDHGSSFETNMRAIAAGFTSLMFDGSAKTWEENASTTQLITRAGHAAGVPVEAELGRVLQIADQVTGAQVLDAMTDPTQAARFVEESGCDSLAIAVGSVHAMQTQAAELDQERIRAIASEVMVPLVLHGSSGVTNDSLRLAIAGGVSKINVGTYLTAGFCQAVRDASAARPTEHDMRKLLGPAREVVQERVREKIRLFGSSGTAADIIGNRSAPGYNAPDFAAVE